MVQITNLRQWLGSGIVLVVTLLLAVLPVWAGFSHWLLVGAAVFAAVGFLMTWPFGEEPDSERSAFVRGDASGSSFDQIIVDGADSFVEGNAIGAQFRRIVFRARRGLNPAARRRKGR